MGLVQRLCKGLLVSAVAASASIGLVGCGPDYAIFAVHVTSASPRDDIETCKMSIKDEAGKDVLVDYTLNALAGAPGDMFLKQGCGGGMTPQKVGVFSYSTSRSSGNLDFTVTAWGGPARDLKVQEGSSSGNAVKAFPPEIRVDVNMTRTSN